MNRYADMLSLPHPVSSKHPRMSVHDRAAQFAPFAALTGYEDAIGEAGRLTEHPVFLTESAVEELNLALQALAAQLPQRPNVMLTWYRPDERKAGGAIINITGIVKKIDSYHQLLLLEDGTKVPLQALLQLQFPDQEEIL